VGSGLLISFEGIDGSGKSTQLARLAARLREVDVEPLVVREPGGTHLGEQIRDIVLNPGPTPRSGEADALLFHAARAQNVREVIRPALSRGEIIVCDRFYDSTTAYQGYGRQLDLQSVRGIVDVAVGNTRPDLTLFLKVPPAVSEERLRSRQATMPFIRDRIEEADRAFFERVAKGYDAIALAEPARVKVINAAATIAEVQSSIWRLVAPLVATGGG
jgi:dTMP kinase